ncbi:uncharacterized protein ATNIH1004_011642 [Aspergillus tanneri]|uniref:Uncharacterized protein n=1 Tax=Aspergillus tanneri TaxID=1220188 RepID=A0A5M9M7E1_9EURO|nr:uncharacterized protein ATNIH1004_011642 [Aspergillus tanneri]KAA8641506.1 hypothetical protein ATNIH1004_011642 [Aspergillus tanneri]
MLSTTKAKIYDRYNTDQPGNDMRPFTTLHQLPTPRQHFEVVTLYDEKSCTAVEDPVYHYRLLEDGRIMIFASCDAETKVKILSPISIQFQLRTLLDWISISNVLDPVTALSPSVM